MTERTVTIPNVSCNHCIAAITRELGDVEGVTGVRGNAAAKSVTITWEPPATWDDISAVLTEIGYPAAL